MKNKSLAILFIFVLCASSAIAQNTDNTRFGILGGVNFQNLSGKDYNGDKLDYKMTVGFHAGFNVLIPLVPEFYFQPGLLFSTKGAKNSNDSFTSKYSISYIEMPLNFVYKAALGDGHFLLGFGPYIGYGIKGKIVSERTGQASVTDEIKFKNTVELSDPSNVPYLKALDAGGNIFAGYELSSGIFFQINTQFGMLKINPENKKFQNDKSSVKNTGFGFSLGYRF